VASAGAYGEVGGGGWCNACVRSCPALRYALRVHAAPTRAEGARPESRSCAAVRRLKPSMPPAREADPLVWFAAPDPREGASTVGVAGVAARPSGSRACAASFGTAPMRAALQAAISEHGAGSFISLRLRRRGDLDRRHAPRAVRAASLRARGLRMVVVEHRPTPLHRCRWERSPTTKPWGGAGGRTVSPARSRQC